MLAVKKLTDLRKSMNQVDVNTLRRKIPGTLDIVTIESVDNGEGHSPHTPKMTTFQDSELSYELQTAMSNSCQETLTIKNTQGISRSQESIGVRSRGSGHSQENMLSKSATSSRSQESLGSGESSSGSSGGSSSTQPRLIDNSTNSQGRPNPESYGAVVPQLNCPDEVNSYSNGCVGSPLRERNLPEGMDQYQRPGALKGDFPPHMVPTEPPNPLLATSPCTSPHAANKVSAPYVFMYPHVSMKTQQPHSPSVLEQAKSPDHVCAQKTTLQSTAQKAFSYLHSHCGGTEPPRVPPKPDASREPQNGEGLKHKKRSHSLNRYALSDGEPEEEEPPTSSVSSYATLSRRSRRSQGSRLHPPSDAKVSRSQSFAIRAKRKGPPPPPPKRLSSVSSAQAVDGECEQGLEPQKGSSPSQGREDHFQDADSSLRSASAVLEGPTAEESPSKSLQSPNPMDFDEGVVGLHNSIEGDPSCPEAAIGRNQLFDSTISRKRTFSEPAVTVTEALQQNHEDVQSDSEEEARVGKDGQAKSPCSSQNSSSECIPFAEEGNLTIKQRPKPVGPLKMDATMPDSDSTQAQSSGKEQGDPAQETPVPEFNLTESDTVKRRPRCKERESLQNVLKAFGVDAPSSATTAPAPQYAQAQTVSISGPSLLVTELQSTADAFDNNSMELQIAEIEKSILSLERGIKKPPVSLKPTSPVPLQVERQGRSTHLRAPATGTDASAKHTSIASTKLVFSGPKTIYQQVLQNSRNTVAPWAATEMVSEVTGPYPMKLGLGGKPALNFGVPLPTRPLNASPDMTQVHQRLEQTSSSLVSTLEVAEKKFTAEDADRHYGTAHSTKNILEDISNMFDDLAEQLDAMLD
ncbi:caskin-2-like [Sphaerodactylus townsendi]|uniref:Uncharacterized protein n=1 Tax=Sphaerodactylus townsendi TaxID=933632 RepID=A0ACB8EKG0_9SAUR|nr:caskin-2-like [Sphaerodactylus townsendi]